MSISYDATYSAEDNKLRLYASERVDDDTYATIKHIGFKWALKQELFVAPKWTPAREDICIELAGEITAEQSTMVERAEAKAERLEDLADKRAEQATGFGAAAARISQRFEFGQPILIGHHSERKARKDQERMKTAMAAAVKAHDSVSYWKYKATGVECHANHKSNPVVRARRIKTLLAELRDRQRDLNHAFICLDKWDKLESETDVDVYEKLVDLFVGARLKGGAMAPQYPNKSLYSQLKAGDVTRAEVVEKCFSFHEYQAQSPFTARWISHILNRLAFERSELGDVARFEGDVTPAMIQIFVREHGADKPKASKEGDGFKLVSPVPLPLHLGETDTLVLSIDGWRDLMQSVGYSVPALKPKKVSILNFSGERISVKMWSSVSILEQYVMTKAEYSKVYSDYRGVKYSACGEYRVKVCKHPEHKGWDAPWIWVFLSDSKEHTAPENYKTPVLEAVA